MSILLQPSKTNPTLTIISFDFSHSLFQNYYSNFQNIRVPNMETDLLDPTPAIRPSAQKIGCNS